eukprot:6031943-Pleurochrysis_carterae.AAC.1
MAGVAGGYFPAQPVQLQMALPGKQSTNTLFAPAAAAQFGVTAIQSQLFIDAAFALLVEAFRARIELEELET